MANETAVAGTGGVVRRILCPSCNGFLIKITTHKAHFDINCGRSRCGDLVTVVINGDSVVISAQKKIRRA